MELKCATAKCPDTTRDWSPLHQGAIKRGISKAKNIHLVLVVTFLPLLLEILFLNILSFTRSTLYPWPLSRVLQIVSRMHRLTLPIFISSPIFFFSFFFFFSAFFLGRKKNELSSPIEQTKAVHEYEIETWATEWMRWLLSCVML